MSAPDPIIRESAAVLRLAGISSLGYPQCPRADMSLQGQAFATQNTYYRSGSRHGILGSHPSIEVACIIRDENEVIVQCIYPS